MLGDLRATVKTKENNPIIRKYGEEKVKTNGQLLIELPWQVMP